MWKPQVVFCGQAAKLSVCGCFVGSRSYESECGKVYAAFIESFNKKKPETDKCCIACILTKVCRFVKYSPNLISKGGI